MSDNATSGSEDSLLYVFNKVKDLMFRFIVVIKEFLRRFDIVLDLRRLNVANVLVACMESRDVRY